MIRLGRALLGLAMIALGALGMAHALLAALGDRHEWTTLFVAVAPNGAAWAVTGSLTSERRPRRARAAA